LRRDVDRLRELGYPVDASRGLAGGYQLRAGAALPPLVLDDDEAVAIAVGLRTAAGGAVAGIEETSVRALTKVVQVMPPRLRRRVDALGSFTETLLSSRDTVDADALVVIAQACRDDERLGFDYVTRDGDPSKRRVEPHRMVSLGRRWYLVAYDLDRHDWRSFRVDRLQQPRTTGVRFRQRELPAPDAVTYVRRSLRAAPQRWSVVVDVEAAAEPVASRFGRWAEVVERAGRGCTLRMQVDTLDWVAMLLGSLDAEFTVREPAELEAHLRSIGERFLRSTG
jgi:predicted DNA-binding transcriptional regulator YafY